MTRISELVTIHSGYAQYVNLAQTFSDPTENRGRMEQYMPVKSHREAFTRIARALYPIDERVYLLTGSYGTGKSHLCLMLANYLALKSDDPEMQAFFSNWAKRDPEGAERLRSLRSESGVCGRPSLVRTRLPQSGQNRPSKCQIGVGCSPLSVPRKA